MERTLHGSCACGRNTYIIRVPPSTPHPASILFDSSHHTRRHQATPFAAYLRVPLTWYHSSTTPLSETELPTLIRRTYLDQTACRRQFCGLCGTPLSAWHERTPLDAEFIALTLGSLRESEVAELEDLGLFGRQDSVPASREGSPQTMGGEEGQQQPRLRREVFGPLQVVEGRGAPWFERLVEESRLGRVQRVRGGTGAEEWEVMEWSTGG